MPLNILHMSTYSYGGAGTSAMRLHKGLMNIGENSIMYSLSMSSSDDNTRVGYLPQDNNQNIPVEVIGDGQVAEWLRSETFKTYSQTLEEYPHRSRTMEAFSGAESLADFSLVEQIERADIVNLHWVAGMLDYSSIPNVLKNKKIVWTLHDMNPFTGGCHYAGGCEKYKQRCFRCPLLGASTNADYSSKNWLIKAAALNQLDINIVTPSKWLGECAKSSSLFQPFKVDVIPYGLPLNEFIPYEAPQVKEQLKIREGNTVILFGAQMASNPRKGIRYLFSALSNLPESSRKNITLLVFGSLPEGVKFGGDYQTIPLGYLDNPKDLAVIYSLSDAFVVPTLEDNLPNTVLESLACGTPVVGFDVGGMPDMIEHDKTGYLARERDVFELMNGILWAHESKGRSKEFRVNCRRQAEAKFALERQALDYQTLYKRILGQ